MGWFGPRGLASIILALVVVEEEPGLAGIDEIFLVMTVTVLLSVFAHGVTAAPLTRLYARPGPGADGGQHTSDPGGRILVR
jgi:sodium/hydrogen antiporter